MLNKIASVLIIASAICWLVQKADDVFIKYVLTHVAAVLK